MMKRDDPRLYVSIQHVLGIMAIKEHTASRECDQLIKDEAAWCSISYEAGKRDALKDISKWLRTYTSWADTLAEARKE